MVRDAMTFGSDALAFGSDTVGKAFDFGQETVRQTMSNLTSTLNFQQQQNRQGIESALAAVRSSVTDDTAETVQQMVMWGGIAAAVIGLAWAARN